MLVAVVVHAGAKRQGLLAARGAVERAVLAHL
jgi:hypothetical protein